MIQPTKTHLAIGNDIVTAQLSPHLFCTVLYHYSHFSTAQNGTQEKRWAEQILTWLDDIMVTAVKMSRPYTATFLSTRMYFQMYLRESQSLLRHNGGGGRTTYLRRVRKSDRWNSGTLIKSNWHRSARESEYHRHPRNDGPGHHLR